MSTKLYNGIKFKTNDIFELMNQLKELKEKCVPIGVGKLCDKKELAFFIRHNKLVEKKTYSIYCELRNNLNQEARNILDFNALFSLVIFPYNNQIYGYYFNDGIEEYKDLLSEIAEDFHYQNQCDRPEHISESEWDEREKIWNDILGYDSFSQRGLKFEVVSTLDLFDYKYSQEIFNAINSAIEEINNSEKEQSLSD